MARRRMIDPTIWTNRKFIRLAFFERLFFIGLVSQADDEGKLWNDGLALKAGIFPADNLSLDQIEGGLERLASVGLISCDDEVIQLKGWTEYQTIDRPKKSSIPDVKEKEEKAIVERSTNDRRTIDEHPDAIEVKLREEKLREANAREAGEQSDHVPENFTAVRDSFQSKNPLWPDIAKEVKAIGTLCYLAEKTPNAKEALRSWVETFWNQTQTSAGFWQRQPFLPSRMLALLGDVEKLAHRADEFSGDWVNDYIAKVSAS